MKKFQLGTSFEESQPTSRVAFRLKTDDVGDVRIYADIENGESAILIGYFTQYSEQIKLELMGLQGNDEFAQDSNGFIMVGR